MTELKYKTILLSLIASLTPADNMGDVTEDIEEAFNQSGVALDWDDLDELAAELASIGVATLCGTSLSND